MAIFINGLMVVSISGLSAVTFTMLLSILSNTAPRLQGNHIIPAKCTALLTEQIIVDGFKGTCTLYKEGYVVFDYFNDVYDKNTYTVADLFGEYTYYSVDPSLNKTVDLSYFGAMTAFDVIMMVLSNNIEYNISEHDKKKSISSDFDYTYGKKEGVHYQDNINMSSPDYITAILNKATEAERKKLKLDMIDCIVNAEITSRQRQVIDLLYQKKTLQEIANDLHLTVSTVEEHRDRAIRNIQRKWNKEHPDELVKLRDVSKYDKKSKKQK